MLTAILKLSKFNIPVAVVWYHENTIQVEGTEALKKLLDDMKDGPLERAVKEDVLQFSAPQPADPPCDVLVDIGEFKIQLIFNYNGSKIYIVLKQL